MKRSSVSENHRCQLKIKNWNKSNKTNPKSERCLLLISDAYILNNFLSLVLGWCINFRSFSAANSSDGILSRKPKINRVYLNPARTLIFSWKIIPKIAFPLLTLTSILSKNVGRECLSCNEFQDIKVCF